MSSMLFSLAVLLFLLNSPEAFSLKKCEESFHSLSNSGGITETQAVNLLIPVRHLDLFAQNGDSKSEKVKYTGDLAEMTESDFLKLENVDSSDLQEVRTYLSKLDLHFGMDLPADWRKNGKLTKDGSKKSLLSVLNRPLLSSKEEKALRLRFGINKEKKRHTFIEIGQKLGIETASAPLFHGEAYRKLTRLAERQGYIYSQRLTSQEIEKLIKQQKNFVKLTPVLTFSIEKIKLSPFVKKSLRNNGVHYFGDLIVKTEKELLRVAGLERGDLVKIKKELSKVGLSFGTNINWPLENREQVEEAVRELRVQGNLVRPVQSVDKKTQRKLFLSIENLDLPSAIYEILKNHGLKYIGDLVMRTELELLKYRYFERRELIAVRNHLSEKGMYLGMDFDWPLDLEEAEKFVQGFLKKGNLLRSIQSLDLEIQRKLILPIESLSLSTRSLNILKKAGIRYVGDIVSKTKLELLSLKKIGSRVLSEVKARLLTIGLDLEMNLNWSSEPEKVEELSKALGNNKSIKSLDIEIQRKLILPVEVLNIYPRFYGMLRKQGINYVGDLAVRREYELTGFRNGVSEIKNRLSEMGLELGMNFDWPLNPEKVEEKVKELRQDKSLKIPIQSLDAKMQKNLFIPLKDSGLSIRSVNVLKRKGMTLIGDLVISSRTELFKPGVLGKSSFDKMEAMLLKKNLTLEMNLDWPPSK